MDKISCKYCESYLSNNIIALNKKLLGRKIVKFMCISCFADFLGCSEDDLLVKIEEFKEQECSLFS